MSYGVAGSSPFGVFTKIIPELVKDLIYAQYGLVSPAKEDVLVQADRQDPKKVLIGTSWAKTGIHKLNEIHVIQPGPAAVVGRVNGWHRVKYRADVEIHVFVRRNSEGEPPAALIAMTQEVDRIVTRYPKGLAQGAGPIFHAVGWDAAHDPTDLSTAQYWRFFAQFGVLYDMVSTA